MMILAEKDAECVCNFVISEFDSRIGEFYKDEDLHQGRIMELNRQGVECEYPIMSISMAGVNLSTMPRVGHLMVVDACTQMKSRAKKHKGSCFVLNQRK